MKCRPLSAPILSALAFVLTSTVVVTAAEPTSAERPNVVYIMADDLGWGDVGCYGAKGVKTPNIDRLAQEGVRFTDAHSETACCTPTRYGVLTGRYSWRTHLKSGVLWWDAPLMIDPERLTLPKLFRASGYATACVGKWHLGLGTMPDNLLGDKKTGGPLSRGQFNPGPHEVGFDSYFIMPGSNHGNPILVENGRFVDPADAARVAGIGDADLKRQKQEAIGPQLTAKAVEFIEKHADRPFFLYFTPCAIHLPYTPAKQFQGTSELGPRGDFIHELDWSVGQVLDALKRLKLADRTLVIVTSDNGGDRPGSMGRFREHKTSVYEGGHRVPFVARWPDRIVPGGRSDETLCLSDMLATCAAILGQKLPNDAAEDSFNVLPLLLSKKPIEPVRPAMINKACRGPNISIRQGPWKLVYKDLWPTAEGVTALKAGKLARPELYNLADDVGEQTDLAAKQPEVVRRLEDLLLKLIVEGRSRP